MHSKNTYSEITKSFGLFWSPKEYFDCVLY